MQNYNMLLFSCVQEFKLYQTQNLNKNLNNLNRDVYDSKNTSQTGGNSYRLRSLKPWADCGEVPVISFGNLDYKINDLDKSIDKYIFPGGCQ